MREPAKSFEDLLVWQKAHEYVLRIYKMTQSFPREELYGLTSQIRRSAVSVPSNIAEGFKRRSAQEKVRFMNISQGSLEESRYQLILTRDLKYGDVTDLLPLATEVGKLLQAYSSSILNSKS